MTTVGLDLSMTATGVVILRASESYSAFRIETSPRDGPDIERVVNIERQVAAVLHQEKPDLVVLEGYAYGGSQRAHQLGELGGVIRRRLAVEGHRWTVIAPQHLKMFACDSGNAKKELVLQQVLKVWGAELRTNDEADAYVLARIGEAIMVWKRQGEWKGPAWQARALKRILETSVIMAGPRAMEMKSA